MGFLGAVLKWPVGQQKSDKVICHCEEQVPPDLLKMLNLSKNEEILFHKKINSYLAVFKNGKRKLRNDFIVTNSNIIFLGSLTVSVSPSKNWQEKDIIQLSEVTILEGVMKKRHLSHQPFLKIVTSSMDIYELSFSPYGQYTDEINTLLNIIKKLNSQIVININLTEMPWKIFPNKICEK